MKGLESPMVIKSIGEESCVQTTTVGATNIVLAGFVVRDIRLLKFSRSHFLIFEFKRNRKGYPIITSKPPRFL